MNRSNEHVRITLAPKRNRAELAKKQMELYENTRKLAEVQAVLRAHVIDNLQKSLAIAASTAPISESMSEQEALETIQGHLIGHQAVPIHPTVCQYLTSQMDFDASLVTHGEYKGVPVGFIPGLPLLKFVGFIHPDAPTLEEASLLMELNENDTKH